LERLVNEKVLEKEFLVVNAVEAHTDQYRRGMLFVLGALVYEQAVPFEKCQHFVLYISTHVLLNDLVFIELLKLR